MSNAADYIGVVQSIAAMSKDRRKKVGAVILSPEPDLSIRSTGRNGFPRGVDETVEARHQKPEKFYWCCHAEENAIAQAARSGTSTNGCTIVVSTLFPCTTCARLIIQSGIVRVLAVQPDRVPSTTNRWKEEAHRSMQMFREANVEVVHLTQEEFP